MSRHGGRRRGSGRRSIGKDRVQVTLRLWPEEVAELDAELERVKLGRTDLFRELLAQRLLRKLSDDDLAKRDDDLALRELLRRTRDGH